MFEFLIKSKYFIETYKKCEQQELTSIETSNESDLYWKNHFHKNPLEFVK